MATEGLNVERRMLVYYKIIIVIEDSTVLRTNIPHYLMNIMKIETIEHTMKEVVLLIICLCFQNNFKCWQNKDFITLILFSYAICKIPRYFMTVKFY